MASLNIKPFSSSAKQHQRLVIAGRRRGLELAEIRKMVGGSIRRLSAAEASDWITRLSGESLPNPPGQKKSVYAGRKPSAAIRMITTDQIDQIERLMRDYFHGNTEAAAHWLYKNFKAPAARDLATAKRAGEVIAVLKAMHRRRELRQRKADAPAMVAVQEERISV